MKILIIGFLAFSGWSMLSSYIYVCRIKGLCNNPTTLLSEEFKNIDVISDDTLGKSKVQEKTVIPVPENLIIYFAFDKSEFNSDDGTNMYFDKSNAFLDQNSQAKINITGYADAIGSDEYNQALGYRRAQKMQQYFENKGIGSEKIIIESKGEKERADNNNTTEGRANNRRAVITIKK